MVIKFNCTKVLISKIGWIKVYSSAGDTAINNGELKMVKLKKDGKSAWFVAKDPSIRVFKCVKRFRSGEWYVTKDGEVILWCHGKQSVLSQLEELKPEVAA